MDKGGQQKKKQKGGDGKAVKHAEGEEEVAKDAEAVNLKGSFKRDLQPMMYGYGDEAAPLPETVDLVEDIVIDYTTSLLNKAMDGAASRGKLKGKAATNTIGPEDIMFLVRKDPKKYTRIKELLVMQEEIKKARGTIDPTDVKL